MRQEVLKNSPEKYVIVSDMRYESGLLFLQDVKIMQKSRKGADRHWTKYPENAKIFDTKKGAETTASRFKHNNTHAVRIADLKGVSK